MCTAPHDGASPGPQTNKYNTNNVSSQKQQHIYMASALGHEPMPAGPAGRPLRGCEASARRRRHTAAAVPEAELHDEGRSSGSRPSCADAFWAVAKPGRRAPLRAYRFTSFDRNPYSLEWETSRRCSGRLSRPSSPSRASESNPRQRRACHRRWRRVCHSGAAGDVVAAVGEAQGLALLQVQRQCPQPPRLTPLTAVPS